MKMKYFPNSSITVCVPFATDSGLRYVFDAWFYLVLHLIFCDGFFFILYFNVLKCKLNNIFARSDELID